MDFEGLEQERSGSSLHRALPDSLVGIGRYENDRYLEAKFGQAALQLDPAHVRHLHIANQTSRLLR